MCARKSGKYMSHKRKSRKSKKPIFIVAVLAVIAVVIVLFSMVGKNGSSTDKVLLDEHGRHSN